MSIHNKLPIRPTNRNRIYDILDGERDYQDEVWPESERLLTAGEYLLLLEEYIAKARARWSKEHEGQAITMGEFRKIGGVAVRAMEAFGATPREFHVPASAGITGTWEMLDKVDKI